MQFLFNDVMVACPNEMTQQEAQLYVKEQLAIQPNRRLVEVDITLEGEKVFLKPHYESIIRVRRITGYLSTLPRFNDAKRDEEKDRLKCLL